MRAAIYARVSTPGQAIKGESLEEQEERCVGYCQSQDWEIVVTKKDQWTGTEADRPGLDEVRQLCDAGSVDVIVIDDLSRLGRTMAQTIQMLDNFPPIYFVRQPICSTLTDTTEGFIARSIFQMLNELFIRNLRERITLAQDRRLADGRWPGGQTAWGLAFDPETGFLVEDPEHAPAVRLAAQLVLEGKSSREVADLLNAAGHSRPGHGKSHPPKPWSPSEVKRYLRGDQLHGEVSWKGRPINAAALLTETEHTEVKRLLGSRAAYDSGDYLLTGHACSCGGKLIGAGNRIRRKDRTDKRAYWCSKKERCDRERSPRFIPAAELEEDVWASVVYGQDWWQEQPEGASDAPLPDTDRTAAVVKRLKAAQDHLTADWYEKKPTATDGALTEMTDRLRTAERAHEAALAAHAERDRSLAAKGARDKADWKWMADITDTEERRRMLDRLGLRVQITELNDVKWNWVRSLGDVADDWEPPLFVLTPA